MSFRFIQVLTNDRISFFFETISTPHSLHPFIYQWTLRLIPEDGPCEHSDTDSSVRLTRFIRLDGYLVMGWGSHLVVLFFKNFLGIFMMVTSDYIFTVDMKVSFSPHPHHIRNADHYF